MAWRTKNVRRSNELQDLLDVNPNQTIKEHLSNSLAIDESTVSRSLHAMG